MKTGQDIIKNYGGYSEDINREDITDGEALDIITGILQDDEFDIFDQHQLISVFIDYLADKEPKTYPAVKSWTVDTFHHLTYRLTISAPESLTNEDINTLTTALADYTDTPPSQQELDALLTESSGYLPDDLPPEKLELFKLVKIEAEQINRNISSDDADLVEEEL